MADTVTALVDRNLLPDWVLRAAIRRICAQRLREQSDGGPAAHAERLDALLEWLDRQPVAAAPDRSNAQHYDVPPAFFEAVLGPHLKYSCALWDTAATLGDAERHMLDLTMARAGLGDGQSILELGCGWGSLTLHMAASFPSSHVIALSNSASQGRYIRERARSRGLRNVEIVTADINDFSIAHTFDRVVSVEMFEHLRNYRTLFERVATWLRDDGRLFVHVFAHRRFAYPFEVRGDTDWMAEHFFTGGMMPSAGLFARAQHALAVDAEWWLDGTHYERTANAWLRNLDARHATLDAVLRATYGDASERWRARWRVFLMACAEMFGYRGGSEWGVAHLRFRQRG